MVAANADRRREIDRIVADERAEGVRAGLHPFEVAARIVDRVPEMTALEAQRLARGWSRRQLSKLIDELYEADSLAPVGLADETICRWEHGDRTPSPERIDYLCRVYRTRPDRLGFGVDHSASTPGTALPGLIAFFPYTSRESDHDLRSRIVDAEREITVFGLTRNAYARDGTLDLLGQAASRGVAITIYVMDPWCESRRDRYRVEPAEAAMENPERYIREGLIPLREAASAHPNWSIWTFDFPISFAVEKIDNAIRIAAYAPGRRGTESPIFVYDNDFPAYDYFAGQLDWLRARAENPHREPWRSKNIHVRPLTLPADSE
ncbi:hypothetical protein ACFYTQ_13090 [Nocardia sp. NPDC004068]|uniref:hypothetical protein n=1 Tax=Nocardia sp. NPDC004068 TaxID=3364303 RepID=UPI00368623B9